jgi:hypothetical protein
MPYNIFSPQNLFQHNHNAYKPGNQTPDGVITPAGGVVAPHPQPAANTGARVPGLDVAKRIVQQYQAQQASALVGTPVQQSPASSWHGTDATSPDGGFFGWAGRTYTTPQQEQQYRRQSKARMGIMAVADALRHLGNIYHTTQYAPSQQFNKPVEQEYAMYKANKAERDKDNYAIQQQQLAQAKWEADQAYKQATLDWRNKTFDYNKEKDQRNFDYNKEKDQRNFDYNKDKDERNFNYNKEKDERNFGETVRMHDETIRHNRTSESQKQQQINLSWANHNETKRHHAVMEGNDGADGGGTRGTGGGGKQTVYYAGTYGNVSRNKSMTDDEAYSMVKNLHTMGWVTDKKFAEFESALKGGKADDAATLLGFGSDSPTGSKGATGGIIQDVLTYHKDGAKWLAKNYNFRVTGSGTGVPAKVTRITRTPAVKPAPQGTTTVKPAAVKPAPQDTTTVKSAAGGKNAARNGGSTPKNVGSTPKKVGSSKSRTQQNADILLSGNKDKEPLEV